MVVTFRIYSNRTKPGSVHEGIRRSRFWPLPQADAGDATLGSVSQRFLNLIRNGETAEVAAAAEEDPSLVTCRDAQGVSAFLWSIYSRQPLIRDFLLSHLAGSGYIRGLRPGRLHPPGTSATTGSMWSCDLRLRLVFVGLGGAFADPGDGSAACPWRTRTASRITPLRNQPLHACIALSRDPETARILMRQERAWIHPGWSGSPGSGGGWSGWPGFCWKPGLNRICDATRVRLRLTMPGSAVMMGFCWCFRGREEGEWAWLSAAYPTQAKVRLEWGTQHSLPVQNAGLFVGQGF